MSSLRSSLLKNNQITRSLSILNLNNSCYGSSFNTAHLSSISSSSVNSTIVGNNNNNNSNNISNNNGGSTSNNAINSSTTSSSNNSNALSSGRSNNLPLAPSISSGIGSIVNNSNHLFSSAEISDCGSSGLIGVSQSPPVSASNVTEPPPNTLNICNNGSVSSPNTTNNINNNKNIINVEQSSSQPMANIKSNISPTLAFKNMFSFHNSFESRNRADSVSTTMNTSVDIENPQVWNNHPLVINADEGNDKNKTLFNKYSLRLPAHLEMEFLDHHFNSQILLLRITNIIGILSVTYGFTKHAIFMLLAVRILCLNLFAFSIFLSFLKNKNFYKQAYHPLFLFSFTTYFITILLEYRSTTTTYILFLYTVTFCSLYALGCLLFVWMIILNLMQAACFIIFLLVQSSLDKINIISFTLYILLVLIMGSSHLYVLEKSRKESFVDSKRLLRKAECLRIEKEKSEQLLHNILPEFVIKMMKDFTPTSNLDILNNYLTSSNSALPPISKDFPDCSILYCDIVEFTSLASKVEPELLVRLLNEVFTEFDKVVDSHQCEKIKTDGDAYVCAGGLTIVNSQHYKAIIDIAIDIINLPILKKNCLNDEIKIRVGVATGSVIGGVIGCDKFQFDVWGEAIAMAHTLEQNGSPGKIHIAQKGTEKLSLDDYILIENVESNLGVQTYFINSKRPTDGATINIQSNRDVNLTNGSNQGSEKTTHISLDTVSCPASSPSASLPSSTPSTPRKKNKKNETFGDIIMKPIRQGLFKKDDPISVSVEDPNSCNSDVEAFFMEYTRLNYWIVQFRNLFVELEFHKYVINSTLFETKFFVFIGAILHVVFYVDDRLMGSQLIFSYYIYITLLAIYFIYFLLSFTRLFKNVYIYQIAFFLLLLMFGISTILELMRFSSPLVRSSLTRISVMLFYVNVFHPLSFISATFLNIFIFIFFFLCATQISPQLISHMYLTDYMGIISVLIIQVCASYGMKLGMRKAWIIKSKVKYKGLIVQKERERSSKLLGNILPTSISERLMKEGKGKGNGMLIAQKYSHVAIMFINIIGFEKLPVQLEASVMVSHMNYIFSIFDGQLARYELEKIKTIGTTYMVVSGLDTSQSPKIFLANAANMALTAKAYVKHIDENLNVQIGISFGPCVAGCIGIQRAKFDVWGDTANTASRMQTSAPPGKIQVTREVHKILKRGFFLEERGIIKVKGKGEMISYYLTGKRGSSDKLNENGDDDQLPHHWKLAQTKTSPTLTPPINTT